MNRSGYTHHGNLHTAPAPPPPKRMTKAQFAACYFYVYNVIHGGRYTGNLTEKEMLEKWTRYTNLGHESFMGCWQSESDGVPVFKIAMDRLEIVL